MADGFPFVAQIPYRVRNRSDGHRLLPYCFEASLLRHPVGLDVDHRDSVAGRVVDWRHIDRDDRPVALELFAVLYQDVSHAGVRVWDLLAAKRVEPDVSIRYRHRGLPGTNGRDVQSETGLVWGAVLERLTIVTRGDGAIPGARVVSVGEVPAWANPDRLPVGGDVADELEDMILMAQAAMAYERAD